MNEGIHLDPDTWIVPGQIRKATDNILVYKVGWWFNIDCVSCCWWPLDHGHQTPQQAPSRAGVQE